MTPEEMREAIVFRPFKKTDLEQLVALDLEAFPDLAWQESDFLFYKGTVAVLGDKIVGYIFYLPRTLQGAAYISNLVVRLGFKRHKIGSRLLQRLISKNKLKWELEVAIDGPLAFYHTHGFRVIELVKDFYGDGLDAYRMELQR